MVICLMVSDAKLWEIIFEGNFSFFSQNMTRNWTFDKFNLFITSEKTRQNSKYNFWFYLRYRPIIFYRRFGFLPKVR